MSIAIRICGAVRDAVAVLPSFQAFDPEGIYIGFAPEDASLPFIVVADVREVRGAAKGKQVACVVHLWTEYPADPSEAGDLQDAADQLSALLEQGAFQPEAWVHQPEPQNNRDHVALPVIVDVDALPEP